MEGQEARVALGAIATVGSGTGAIRAKTSRSVGSCEQRSGRLKHLFKRPTRARGNRAENSAKRPLGTPIRTPTPRTREGGSEHNQPPLPGVRPYPPEGMLAGMTDTNPWKQQGRRPPRSPGRSATDLSRAKAFAPSVAMPGCPAGRRFSAGSLATRNFATGTHSRASFRHKI
jgi:hypothetical protein